LTLDLRFKLEQGIKELGFSIADEQITKLLDYLRILYKWNQTYNITGHDSVDEMLSLHILDSLSIINPLQEQLKQCINEAESKVQILDVGSGAGLPGVVLSICLPQYHIVCLDAVSKKTAFLQYVKSVLCIPNVTVLNSRIEKHAKPYHVVTSRAFSSLNQFTSLTNHCLDTNGFWMAMKGKHPSDELNMLDEKIEAFHVEHLNVPNINALRCLIFMRKKARNKSS